MPPKAVPEFLNIARTILVLTVLSSLSNPELAAPTLRNYVNFLLEMFPIFFFIVKNCFKLLITKIALI